MLAHMKRSAPVLLSILVLWPASASVASADARDARDWGRIALDLGLGFVGEQVEDGPDPNLAMTLAASARLEKPVSRAFTLGGMVTAGFWRTEAMENADIQRNARLDVDLILKPRYAWRVGHGHMEIGLPIPVGFTLQGDNEDAGLSSRGIGYNVGASLSWQWFPGHRAGFLLEFGWKRHETHHDPGEIVTQELMLNMGVAFLL